METVSACVARNLAPMLVPSSEQSACKQEAPPVTNHATIRIMYRATMVSIGCNRDVASPKDAIAVDQTREDLETKCLHARSLLVSLFPSLGC